MILSALGKGKKNLEHHPIHLINFFPQNPQGRIQKLNANIHPVGFMVTGGALNGFLGVGCFFGGGRDFPVWGARDWPTSGGAGLTCWNSVETFFLKSAGPVDFLGVEFLVCAPFFRWFFDEIRLVVSRLGGDWALGLHFFLVGVNTPRIVDGSEIR